MGDPESLVSDSLSEICSVTPMHLDLRRKPQTQVRPVGPLDIKEVGVDL